MSIKFLCPHCKKVVSVKDDAAGKKGKCPHCTQLLTVPAPTRPSPPAVQPAPPAAPPPKAAAPPPKPAAPPVAPPPPETADIEAEAAAALGDEPRAEADMPPASTIDFTCPMCDEELHMALELAGKREPCPKCRRIIKVPEPAKRDPANWRAAAPSLPSGAKRVEEIAPEGAWGSATAAASVSQESLQDAGAVVDVKEPVTLRQRIVRIALVSSVIVLLVVGAVLGFLKFMNHREEQAVEAAVSYADSDQGKTELGRDGRAAVYRLAGEHTLRSGETGCARAADDLFKKSLGILRESSDPGASATEHDALLQDLAPAEVELGGTPEEVAAGLKVSWDDVQKDLQATLATIHNSDARLESLREVARRLALKGEGARAQALASKVYPTANRDKAEALGAVGLELLAAGKTELAGKAAEQVLQLYASKDENRPALAPAAVALTVALGGDWKPPEPAKKGSKWAADDPSSDLLGRAEGLARAHQWDAARLAAANANLTNDLPLRAYMSLAGAALDDKTAGKTDIEEAIKRAPTTQSSWLLLRLTRLGARAGVAPDSLQSVAGSITDRDLRGRAQLAALKAQFAQGKPVDLKALDDAVEPQTLSARLAREEWARHNSGSIGVIKAWKPPNRAFGLLGAALGPQDEE